MGNKTVRAETFVQLEQLGKLTKKDNDEIHKDLVKIGEQIWRDELQCLLLLKDSFVRQCATLHAIVDARDDIEESRRVQWHVAIDEWFPTVIANCERLVVHAEQSLHDCLLSPPQFELLRTDTRKEFQSYLRALEPACASNAAALLQILFSNPAPTCGADIQSRVWHAQVCWETLSKAHAVAKAALSDIACDLRLHPGHWHWDTATDAALPAPWPILPLFEEMNELNQFLEMRKTESSCSDCATQMELDDRAKHDARFKAALRDMWRQNADSFRDLVAKTRTLSSTPCFVSDNTSYFMLQERLPLEEALDEIRRNAACMTLYKNLIAKHPARSRIGVCFAFPYFTKSNWKSPSSATDLARIIHEKCSQKAVML